MHFVGPYHLGALLFETKNSITYESFHPQQCQKLCLKLIKKSAVSLELIQNEVNIMKQISHSSIIPLIDEFDWEDYQVIVMPFASGGDLFEFISANQGMDERAAAQVMYCALTAVKHLHANGIWHRDIKPENFLFMDDNLKEINLVLCDLGFAKHFPLGTKSNEFLGTPNYSAPEIYKKEFYDQSVDIWSLGITMYMVLSGEFPFPLSSSMDTLHAILKGEYDFDSAVWDDVSEEAKDLIQQMLRVNPEERITAEMALTHCWFKRFFPDCDKPRLQREMIGGTHINNAFEQADAIESIEDPMNF